MSYVGRFAPSPTGDMHLGIARTSLAAWLDARAHDGRMLMRIEDVDGPREVAGSRERLLEDFAWLGLDFDGDVVRQSQRCTLYEAALKQLDAADRVFLCSCSRKDIRAASAPHADDPRAAIYPGTCRQRGGPLPDRNPATRLKTRAGDFVKHRDRNESLIDEDVSKSVGDFVLRRADGLWSYQLAVTVDDLEQGITCIVRGDDLLESTGRQLLLRRLLKPDAEDLTTLHVPIMLDNQGRRLAKRHQSPTVRTMRDDGASAEQIIGTLAQSLGLTEEDTPRPAKSLIEVWSKRFVSQVADAP